MHKEGLPPERGGLLGAQYNVIQSLGFRGQEALAHPAHALAQGLFAGQASAALGADDVCHTLLKMYKMTSDLCPLVDNCQLLWVQVMA